VSFSLLCRFYGRETGFEDELSTRYTRQHLYYSSPLNVFFHHAILASAEYAPLSRDRSVKGSDVRCRQRGTDRSPSRCRVLVAEEDDWPVDERGRWTLSICDEAVITLCTKRLLFFFLCCNCPAAQAQVRRESIDGYGRNGQRKFHTAHTTGRHPSHNHHTSCETRRSAIKYGELSSFRESHHPRSWRLRPGSDRYSTDYLSHAVPELSKFHSESEHIHFTRAGV